jgi:hypothetical protein
MSADGNASPGTLSYYASESSRGFRHRAQRVNAYMLGSCTGRAWKGAWMAAIRKQLQCPLTTVKTERLRRSDGTSGRFSGSSPRTWSTLIDPESPNELTTGRSTMGRPVQRQQHEGRILFGPQGHKCPNRVQASHAKVDRSSLALLVQ